MISIFSFILLFFSCLPFKNGSSNLPSPPNKFLSCKKNSDCVLAGYTCGTIAVHRSYKDKYQSWREKTFLRINFDCATDLSYYEPQCLNFKCKEVKKEIDQCNTDEDCMLVQKNCCECFDLAIHKSKLHSYTNELKNRCKNTDCSSEKMTKQCVTGPDRPTPKCLKSQCTI